MPQEITYKMFQDKLEEARQNGILEGRELTLLEMAKNMSEKGCTIELISEVTGLSMADIKHVLS